ncbi:MAG: pilin [Zoogloeaceae bacterium]|nr:pilin [Zoogloeaceae bacterium]
MVLASAAKIGIAEFYASNGYWAGSNASVGLPGSQSVIGNAVIKLLVTNSRINIMYSQTILPITGVYPSPMLAIQGHDEGGSISWNCGDRTGGKSIMTNIPNKWLPANCRQ